MSQTEKLRLEHVRFRYGSLEVLKGLSFQVDSGEIVGLLGPNGAGKSTLFQILAGLQPPQEGSFYVDGKICDPLDPKIRETFGIVFQQPSLDPKLGALENLLLSAALYRVPKSVARERAGDLLRWMELADRATDRVEKFSGGMRRRLEIARALMHQPKFLLLDEPTSGLDVIGFEKLWTQLQEIRRQQGITLLLTTHRSDEAERCDRLLMLDRGVILAEGSPTDLKGRIGGDVLELHLRDISLREAVKQQLADKFGLSAQLVENHMTIEHPRGHELIPRIVERFAEDTFASIQLHRPTLADLFVQLTGRSLAVDTANVDTKPKAGKKAA